MRLTSSSKRERKMQRQPRNNIDVKTYDAANIKLGNASGEETRTGDSEVSQNMNTRTDVVDLAVTSVTLAITNTNGTENKENNKNEEDKDNTPKENTNVSRNKSDKANRSRKSTEVHTREIDKFNAMEEIDLPSGFNRFRRRMSVYAIEMITDFRYYFQYPFLRLLTSYLVMVLGFIIYIEDPISDSSTEASLPVVGNSFSFIFTKYARNAWDVLKVLLWLQAILVGLIFDNLLRLKMFSRNKGSWMIMLFSTILSLFIYSHIYNGFLRLGGDATLKWRISTKIGISNQIFMKIAAFCIWCGNWFMLWMVTDVMLQGQLYPEWVPKVRHWWNKGFNRIIVLWTAIIIAFITFGVVTNYTVWEQMNFMNLRSNELTRAYMASIMLVLDVTIAMQDWDFPHFIEGVDIKLPGLNTSHINLLIPKMVRKLGYWKFYISGKWLHYGVLAFLVLFDLNIWKNQIFYTPAAYAQFIDHNGRIYTATDEFTLKNLKNGSLLTFEFRNSTTDPITGKRFIEKDFKTLSCFHNYSMPVKVMSALPGVIVFIILGVFLWIYGRRPAPPIHDRYAGRFIRRKIV